MPSLFGPVEAFAGDPILSLFEDYKADPRQGKINLGIGVYTDEHGKLPVLTSVEEGFARLKSHERPYIPMEGMAAFRAGVQRVVFGLEHAALQEKRVATIQSLGGTGGLSIAADFLATHRPGRLVHVSDPTWENHFGLFERAGFKTTTYPYWDADRRALDFEGMLGAIKSAEAGSIFILQPVCHNPTGVDADEAQQAALTEALIARGHIVVFDMAYQGFARSLEEDAGWVRDYAAKASCLVVNSFSKTFSLYGERVGGLSIVCESADEADRVLGQLKLAVRRNYSSPPTTGALIVATVLGDEELRRQWIADVGAMRERMNEMRRLLSDRIRARSNAVDVNYLTQQRGMFSYTGLDRHKIIAMRETDGVYLLESGRLCVAGLNHGNLEHVADSYVRAQG